MSIENVLTIIGLLFTVVGAAGTVWLILANRIDTLEQSHNDFKLEVAKSYASITYLKDVEDRLGERFDKIVEELHGMRQDVQTAIVDIAKMSTGSRSKKRMTQ